MNTLNYTLGVVMLGCVLLTGCQVPAKPAAPVKKNTEALDAATLRPYSNASDEADQAMVVTCHKDLVSLEKINPAEYRRQKAMFDKLQQTAVTYSAVRNDVHNDTKDTMDALYKYKVYEVCRSISDAVTNGLVHEGESIHE